MRIQRLLAHVGKFTALAVSVGIAAPGSALGARATHRLVFTTAPQTQGQAGRDVFTVNKLLEPGGPVGEDLSLCVVGKVTTNCTGVVAIVGGLIYTSLRAPSTPTNAPVIGKITGGTGRFKGIRGTLTVVHLTSTKLRLTFQYTG